MRNNIFILKISPAIREFITRYEHGERPTFNTKAGKILKLGGK
jgi:hypothetical protein